MAINLANYYIYVGNITINKPSDDDLILMDSACYNPTSEIVTFDQRWGRRNEKHKAILYGNTYINAYRERLTGFSEEGIKNASKKMNTVMMKEKLKLENPNVFLLPGET